MVTYDWIEVDYYTQKYDHNHIFIALGGGAQLLPSLSQKNKNMDMITTKVLWNVALSIPVTVYMCTGIKISYPETLMDQYEYKQGPAQNNHFIRMLSF